MKRVKRILCFVLPVMLILVIALGVLLPLNFEALKKESRVSFGESGAEGTNFNGVVHAADGNGAASAAKDYKGGAIFLEPNCTYNMSGGTISGHQNVYGGAIYVSNGATFTMTAGTISSNTATFGGAIYVESGGKCYIQGGEIKNNTADSAPSIYVETGGIIEVSKTAKIEGNKWLYHLKISAQKENVGQVGSGLELYTTTLGSYPQTYVGNTMRETLENWFSSSKPTEVKNFNMADGIVWKEYSYNGELYVRCQESMPTMSSHYSDGSSLPSNRYVWFKVEPVKWYILNYDAWQAGSEDIELFSTQILAGRSAFNTASSKGNSWATSDIRSWCNETFYYEAFTTMEQNIISQSAIKNNVTGDYENAGSDGKAANSQDHIYLKSYYEMTSGLFANKATIVASATDFVIGSSALFSMEGVSTVYGDFIYFYWLRSAGTGASSACALTGNSFATSVSTTMTAYGVRPAMRLSVAV